jgi:hypothetical protein
MIILVKMKDEVFNALTRQSVDNYRYRGSLSARYNAGVKQVRLVRKSDDATVVVWPPDKDGQPWSPDLHVSFGGPRGTITCEPLWR